MVIFGISTKQKVESAGEFNCPACASKTTCGRIVIARYFTLFFIPVLPLGRTRTHRFACQRCGSVYSEAAIGHRPTAIGLNG
ncbi:zinc-ribbon domain-containing protein [Roseiconus sp. JC912]